MTPRPIVLVLTLLLLMGAGGLAAAEDPRDAAGWLERGITLLTGPGSDAEALAAFVRAAELAERPATPWLWASAAAERLGRFEEAGQYKARALAPPREPASAPPAPASAPLPASPKTGSSEPSAEPAGEAKAEVEPAADEKDEKEEVDAFQYFFGKKRERKPEPEEEPAKPPL
jgi:hypothetical protein